MSDVRIDTLYADTAAELLAELVAYLERLIQEEAPRSIKQRTLERLHGDLVTLELRPKREGMLKVSPEDNARLMAAQRRVRDAKGRYER